VVGQAPGQGAAELLLGIFYKRGLEPKCSVSGMALIFDTIAVANPANMKTTLSHIRNHQEETMYLPDIFKRFSQTFPDVAEATERIGKLCSESGPMDEKTRHLVQLGIAVGAESKGAVKSHVRRGLDAGATKEELLQAILLSTNLVGFPAMIAAFSWAQEVLDARGV
jgi:alkylhydroperoxidase/carboxymuconolactone decarboxylase family protein YurZ